MGVEKQKMNSVIQALQDKNWEEADYHARKSRVYVMRKVKIKGFYDGKVSAEVFPLHMACQWKAPLNIIKTLYEVYPDAASETDSKYQRCPLHLAVMNSLEPPVISFLAKAGKEAAQKPDVLGRLPIHYSAKDPENGIANTRYLLKVYPVGTIKQDSTGFLPLHVACRTGQSLEVIRMLTRVAPKAVFIKTNKGSNPLQCAKQWGNDKLVQEHLIHLMSETDVVDGLDQLDVVSVSCVSESSFKSNGGLSFATSATNRSKASRSVTSKADTDDMTFTSR